MALQRTGNDRVESSTLLTKVFAQTTTLTPAEVTQLIVVLGAKRGLAMAH